MGLDESKGDIRWRTGAWRSSPAGALWEKEKELLLSYLQKVLSVQLLWRRTGCMQYAIDSDTILPHDSQLKDTWKQKCTRLRYTYAECPPDL